MDDAYLPLKALAAYSGISVRTLRGYLTNPSHALPHYRIGGKILVRRSDYDAWARGFQVRSDSSLDSIVADALKGL